MKLQFFPLLFRCIFIQSLNRSQGDYFLYIFGDISIWFFSELGKGFFQNGNCLFQSFAVNIELVSVIFGFYEIFLVRIFNSYIKGLLRACRNWNPLFIQNLFQERVIVGAVMGIKIRHLHIAMCGPFKIDEKHIIEGPKVTILSSVSFSRFNQILNSSKVISTMVFE